MAEMRRVLSGLIPSRRYAVRIRALNKFGVSSNWSEALEFNTPGDDSIPEAPENLIIDFETPDLILQWDAVGQNTDGSVIMDFAHYKVTLMEPSGASRTYETRQNFFILPFRQNVADFGNPQPEFSVAIRTTDVDGKESTALTGTATNASPQKPQNPTGFASFTMMTVSMAPHEDDNDIEFFEIERSEDESGPFTQVASSSGDTFIDTGVQSSTYYFRYRVRDFFNQASPYSEILQLTTTGAPGIDTDPPEAVQDFASPGSGIDEVTGRAYIDFTWSPNVVDDDLSHFELRAVRTSDSFVRSVIIGPGASSYRLENLEEDTQYSIIIYAYDYMGNRSDPSIELTITTPVDDTAPVAPSGTGVSGAFRSLTVFWDSEFNPRFSHYEVYGSKTQGFTPDTSSQTNKLFSGNASRFVHHVADNETWYFRVRTVNNNDAASDFTDEFSGSSPDGIQSNEPGAPSEAQFRVDAAGNMWIGDEDFVDAPFSVSNLGSALMRNVIITGADMTTGQRIIDTPAFIVTKEGEVTASEINATGGTIGGVTINETNLSGGEIAGSTFNIGSGGINFTGSGNITWEDTANGGIELAHSGYINNSAYRNDNTTGWHIDDNGIVINEGVVSANAIQIGVSSENLLVNSAFTEGTTVATNWASTFGGGAAADFEVSDTLWAYLGKSQHIEVTSSGTWAGVRQDAEKASGTDFANDETIAVSFWVRQTAGSARTAKVFVQTPAGATLWDGNSVNLTVGAWTRVIAVFRLAAAQPELRVSLRINNPQTGDEFYVDGAQLQISDFITDYAPRTLEIPTNYIQSANIASLSADRLTSGQIATAELILTGAGTIRNDPQTFQIDGDGAMFENGSVTLIGGGDGGVGYLKLDATSLRLIAGSDTDNSANTKFKADRTGVYIGGNDSSTAQVYFDTTEEKTVFQSSGTGYAFTIDTDPADDRVLKLTTGGGSPIENFYLTTDGEAYFMGGVISGNAEVDPETIVAGRLTNLVELDGGGLYNVGAGGTFELDGTGLRFWNNPGAAGAPTIDLDATTGDAAFRGRIQLVDSAQPAAFSATYRWGSYSASDWTRRGELGSDPSRVTWSRVTSPNRLRYRWSGGPRPQHKIDIVTLVGTWPQHFNIHTLDAVDSSLNSDIKIKFNTFRNSGGGEMADWLAGVVLRATFETSGALKDGILVLFGMFGGTYIQCRVFKVVDGEVDDTIIDSPYMIFQKDFPPFQEINGGLWISMWHAIRIRVQYDQVYIKAWEEADDAAVHGGTTPDVDWEPPFWEFRGIDIDPQPGHTGMIAGWDSEDGSNVSGDVFFHNPTVISRPDRGQMHIEPQGDLWAGSDSMNDAPLSINNAGIITLRQENRVSMFTPEGIGPRMIAPAPFEQSVRYEGPHVVNSGPYAFGGFYIADPRYNDKWTPISPKTTRYYSGGLSTDWVRFAEGISRTFARFNIWAPRSSVHQFISFTAGSVYSNGRWRTTLHLDAYECYGPPAIRAIRINMPGSTYDPYYLDFKLNNAHAGQDIYISCQGYADDEWDWRLEGYPYTVGSSDLLSSSNVICTFFREVGMGLHIPIGEARSSFGSGAGVYGSSWEAPTFMLQPGPYVELFGLADSPSSGTIVQMPEGFAPRNRQISAGVGNTTGTRTRVNINTNGTIAAQDGISSWCSLDGIRWVPYEF